MSLSPEDLAQLADDHALGLLSETEAALLEEVMARDAGLAQRVGALRDAMLPLDLSAPPRALPDGFEARVAEAIAKAGPLPAVTLPVAANSTAAPRRWGMIAAGIVGLAVGFGGAGLRPVAEPRVVAVLMDSSGVPQAVIEDYGNSSATLRWVAQVSVPADRQLQVWTLPSQEIGATSLGVLEQVAPTRLEFSGLPAPKAAQLYEVTMEPLGGSPTGRPTGPIVGKGFAAPQT
ncbi:MAG: anti-sigma factor [Cypionkella sp.]